jgi:CubicO group peptidase (beta-lactamase class C family)
MEAPLMDSDGDKVRQNPDSRFIAPIGPRRTSCWLTPLLLLCLWSAGCGQRCAAALEPDRALVEENDVDSIKAFLRANFDQRNSGMVIGLVDKHGSRIISAGRLGNGTSHEVDGDTVFGVGSVTKTFTVLLLQEMVERGEMRLDDPVAKYLPGSVRMPSRNGKEITLRDLATHTSGLPLDADNLKLKDAPGENIFAGYTVAKLYAFLSNHTLRREPGTQYEYSNVGMALLGHAIERKAGASFESLVRDGICRPLDMASTRITVTQELKPRLATGHGKHGAPLPSWDMSAIAPAGALRSTANDLLRYVSANLGLTRSRLTPLMAKTHVICHTNSPGIREGETFGNTAMAWMDFGVYQPPGMQILGHGGGAGGYSAFIGFDKRQHRGVVVLSNQSAAVANTYWIGCRILQRARLRGTDIATVRPVREIVGTGIVLDLDRQKGALRIAKVIPNSPAAQSGLSAGLVVRTIDGIPTTSRSLAECVNLLRGSVGASVWLELIDPERNEAKTVEVIRQKFLIDP